MRILTLQVQRLYLWYPLNREVYTHQKYCSYPDLAPRQTYSLSGLQMHRVHEPFTGIVWQSENACVRCKQVNNQSCGEATWWNALKDFKESKKEEELRKHMFCPHLKGINHDRKHKTEGGLYPRTSKLNTRNQKEVGRGISMFVPANKTLLCPLHFPQMPLYNRYKTLDIECSYVGNSDPFVPEKPSPREHLPWLLLQRRKDRYKL